MIIAVLALGIVFGYIRKGSLKNLAYYKIKFVPLILLSCIMQIGIYLAYKYNIEMIQNYDIVIHFVSYIVLFAGLMGNFDNKWFLLITVGIVLNFIVIFLNGGKMPVSLDAAEKIGLDATALSVLLTAKAGTHQLLGPDALLGILGDVIPFALPQALKFFSNIYSVGDIFMFVGILGLLQSIMISHKNQDEINKEEDYSYESFKPMDPLEEMMLFEQKSQPTIGETAIEVDQMPENYGQGTIVLNKSERESLKEEENAGEEISLDGPTLAMPLEKGESPQEDVTEFDKSNQEKEESSDIKEKDSDQVKPIEKDELIEDDKPEVDFNPYKEKQYNQYEEIDTNHQFIIVDGKIKENPNYNLPIHDKEIDLEEEKVEANDIDENGVEELELSHIDLQDKEENSKQDKYMFQNLTDSDRIELMKKMKKRKAEGYTLVEITVGGKKINFWKKDL